ncbi:MAG: M20/M25/M40 family metallo-hydrolase [Capsulimonadales bacterium]|nr:M20/M25/M40 family metallo-hydrolase [Capsulimonadales bacterium]
MSILPSSHELLSELVAVPGPPGQEGAVRGALAVYIAALRRQSWEDPKGNLLVGDPAFREGAKRPRILVTAHLDEIALMVTGVESDGNLRVMPLGGAHPYKWGEGPVEILAGSVAAPTFVPAVLSFGSIHTTAPASTIQQVREGRAVTWDQVRVLPGRTPRELERSGVRPGSRVVLARERRRLWHFGGRFLGSYFLDDRADLVTWLMALERLGDRPEILFAATSSEEVGGEGAQYLMQNYRPEICVALEIGPTTPDAPFEIDAMPTIWVSDSFAATDPRDLERLAEAAQAEGLSPHWQAVTRGGSDASCAAARGLCARPVTIAFAADNSHGFEIMHQEAMEHLMRLLLRYLQIA